MHRSRLVPPPFTPLDSIPRPDERLSTYCKPSTFRNVHDCKKTQLQINTHTHTRTLTHTRTHTHAFIHTTVKSKLVMLRCTFDFCSNMLDVNKKREKEKKKTEEVVPQL